MTDERPLANCVRARRIANGWSQDDLATLRGSVVPGIGAIEQGRFAPSAATALALAAVFGCRVEDLFSLGQAAAQTPKWAWEPLQEPCRYWRATVAGVPRRYPVEAMVLGTVPHDGVFEHSHFRDHHMARQIRPWSLPVATRPPRYLPGNCCNRMESDCWRFSVQVARPWRYWHKDLCMPRVCIWWDAATDQPILSSPARNCIATSRCCGSRWQEGLVSLPDKRVKTVRAAPIAFALGGSRSRLGRVRDLDRNTGRARDAAPQRVEPSRRGRSGAIRLGRRRRLPATCQRRGGTRFRRASAGRL